jgi:hypothetical protein
VTRKHSELNTQKNPTAEYHNQRKHTTSRQEKINPAWQSKKAPQRSSLKNVSRKKQPATDTGMVTKVHTPSTSDVLGDKPQKESGPNKPFLGQGRASEARVIAC